MKVLRDPESWHRGAIGLVATDMPDGLLFAMKKSAPWPVSMEGVNIALDVYWLTESGLVLEYAALFPGMPPYWPDVDARYVLEIPMAPDPDYVVGQCIELPI